MYQYFNQEKINTSRRHYRPEHSHVSWKKWKLVASYYSLNSVTLSHSKIKHFKTMTHLLDLRDGIIEAFHRKCSVVSIVFDIKKTYDISWKYGIFKKLIQYGTEGTISYFTSNFLQDRTIQSSSWKYTITPIFNSKRCPSGKCYRCILFPPYNQRHSRQSFTSNSDQIFRWWLKMFPWSPLASNMQLILYKSGSTTYKNFFFFNYLLHIWTVIVTFTYT